MRCAVACCGVLACAVACCVFLSAVRYTGGRLPAIYHAISYHAPTKQLPTHDKVHWTLDV